MFLQVVRSILHCHEQDGFQLRIDAGGDGRKRLVCALAPRRSKRGNGERETSSKRCLNCNVTLNLRRAPDGNWVTTFYRNVHRHGPHITRVSLRWYRHLAGELANQRLCHNVRVSSLLSQLRASDINLTAQEIRNLIATESSRSDSSSTLQGTERLFEELEGNDEIIFIATFAILEPQSSSRCSTKVIQCKIRTKDDTELFFLSPEAKHSFQEGNGLFSAVDLLNEAAVAIPPECATSIESHSNDSAPTFQLECVAWCTVSQLKRAQRYLYTLQADATCKTNRQRYSLVYFASEDGDKRTVSIATALLRSESTECFHFLWSVALPFFYGSNLRRATVLLTDGDSQLYETADAAIASSIYPRAQRRLCFWHRVIHAFRDSYPTQFMAADGDIGRIVLAFVTYSCYRAETPVEFHSWWSHLSTWLRSADVAAKLPQGSLAMLETLLEGWFRDRRFIASAFTSCRSLGTKATSKSEAENRSLKALDVNDCSKY